VLSSPAEVIHVTKFTGALFCTVEQLELMSPSGAKTRQVTTVVEEVWSAHYWNRNI